MTRVKRMMESRIISSKFWDSSAKNNLWYPMREGSYTFNTVFDRDKHDIKNVQE